MTQIVGSWKVDPATGSLPEKVAAGFNKVTAGMVGAKYEPLLYCGSQLVAGTNYMIICKQSLVTNPPQESIVKFVLNEKPNGEFSINYIEAIVTSAHVMGGWEVKPAVSALPQDVATGFSSLVSTLLGAKYEPLLYCGSQLVAGKNYMIICKQSLVTNPPVEHLVKIVLNKSLDGTFSINYIDTII